MRIIALVSLFALVAVATGSSNVHAQEPLEFLQANKTVASVSQPVILASLDTEAENAVDPPSIEEPPVQKYIVVENDSLSKIADLHATTWKRLFDKNTAIENPDKLKIGDELIIPAADETLAERPLPAPPEQPSSHTNIRTNAVKPAKPAASGLRPAQSAGNTYTYGYCTWYAKSRRMDLPNNLGNADTWVARAAAQGIPTGSAPSAGAIGQQGMHVVYVESVNGDGTVTISEMNYQGYAVISSRTVPASFFMYIY